jgi:hypothetical protein
MTPAANPNPEAPAVAGSSYRGSTAMLGPRIRPGGFLAAGLPLIETELSSWNTSPGSAAGHRSARVGLDHELPAGNSPRLKMKVGTQPSVLPWRSNCSGSDLELDDVERGDVGIGLVERTVGSAPAGATKEKRRRAPPWPGHRARPAASSKTRTRPPVRIAHHDVAFVVRGDAVGLGDRGLSPERAEGTVCLDLEASSVAAFPDGT